MTNPRFVARTLTVIALLLVTSTAFAAERSELKELWWEGNEFRWVRGANYIPSYAINGVEIWYEYDPVGDIRDRCGEALAKDRGEVTILIFDDRNDSRTVAAKNAGQ